MCCLTEYKKIWAELVQTKLGVPLTKCSHLSFLLKELVQTVWPRPGNVHGFGLDGQVIPLGLTNVQIQTEPNVSCAIVVALP